MVGRTVVRGGASSVGVWRVRSAHSAEEFQAADGERLDRHSPYDGNPGELGFDQHGGLDFPRHGESLGGLARIGADLGRFTDGSGKFLGVDLQGNLAGASGRDDLAFSADRGATAGGLDLFNPQGGSTAVFDGEVMDNYLALQHRAPIEDIFGHLRQGWREVLRRRLEEIAFFLGATGLGRGNLPGLGGLGGLFFLG